jgi:hypothetical protein
MLMIPANFAVALPDHIMPPHGRLAAYAFAGFVRAQHALPDGTFAHSFEEANIVRVATPLSMLYGETKVTRIAVHAKVIRWVSAALQEIAVQDLWPFVQRYGGGFQVRLIRGGADYSMHSFGLALDFDPDHNPLGAEPKDTRLGSTVGGLKVVDIFERWGFLWGGHFDGRKDCQHFQWVTGC